MASETHPTSSSPAAVQENVSSNPTGHGNDELSILRSRRTCNEFLLSHVRVGDHILVWWPVDSCYYLGQVVETLPEGYYRIDYDDGIIEDVYLRAEQWRFYGAAETRVLGLYRQEVSKAGGIPKQKSLVEQLILEDETMRRILSDLTRADDAFPNNENASEHLLGEGSAVEVSLDGGSVVNAVLDRGRADDVVLNGSNSDEAVLDGGSTDDAVLGGDNTDDVVLDNVSTDDIVSGSGKADDAVLDEGNADDVDKAEKAKGRGKLRRSLNLRNSNWALSRQISVRSKKARLDTDA